MHRELLREILQSRRRALTPEELGLPARRRRPGPQVVGLTQTDIDLVMNRGLGTYGKVESGQLHPSAEYLLELGRVLRMREEEYAEVHLLLFGGRPPTPLHDASGLRVRSAWQRVLAQQSHIAYVHDRRFNILGGSAAWLAAFPAGRSPGNLLQWALTDRAARHCLLDWDRSWGPRAASSLRTAIAAYPRDPFLAGLHERAVRDPAVRALLTAPVPPVEQSLLLRHPRQGVGEVTLMTAEPAEAPGARYVIVLFDTPKKAPAAANRRRRQIDDGGGRHGEQIALPFPPVSAGAAAE